MQRGWRRSPDDAVVANVARRNLVGDGVSERQFVA